jgi:hypothetical protein
MGLAAMSISTRFALVFIVAMALVGAAFYTILDRIYLDQLKSQAETVADNVDAFGTWVAQYGRVWVKDDAHSSYLGHLPLLQADDGATATPGALRPVNFYSKNPALAQREFSEIVARSGSPAKFRLTSHNVMNPANAPDAFELIALKKIREGGLAEYFELNDDGFRYARTVYHKTACIGCHGEAERAPSDVKVRYGTANGFGFRAGDVAGIISVRVPARSFRRVAFTVAGGGSLAMIIAAFLLAMLFVRFAIVAPINRLTHASHQISLAQPANLGVRRIPRRSRNEIHQLTLAIERLRRSVQLAMHKLGEDQPVGAAAHAPARHER